MAPVAAPAWRLSVTTVGAAEMRFVVPCGDGDITVLELTRRLMERCQSLMPDVPLLADRSRKGKGRGVVGSQVAPAIGSSRFQNTETALFWAS